MGGNAPKCVQVLCPPATTLEGGSYEDIPSCSNRVTSICRAVCPDGFTMFYGTLPLRTTMLEITCANTATWFTPPLLARFPVLDISRLRCVELPKPMCNPILIPDNGEGTSDCTAFELDKTCTISCNFGFELVGNPIYDCKAAGPLNRPTIMPPQTERPVCRPVLCPGLSAPSNGYVMGTCSPGKPGMSCMFGCNTGYMLAPPG